MPCEDGVKRRTHADQEEGSQQTLPPPSLILDPQASEP